MKTYDVTITAQITKTYRVEANSVEGAHEAANEIFSVLCDDVDENYDQETLDVEEVTV
jgi:hypothetical protein